MQIRVLVTLFFLYILTLPTAYTRAVWDPEKDYGKYRKVKSYDSR